MLVEALGQIKVNILTYEKVPMLMGLFGKSGPQEEELAQLPTISLLSSLMVLLPEESDLGLLAEASKILSTSSLAPTPTSGAIPPSLAVAPVTFQPAFQALLAG